MPEYLAPGVYVEEVSFRSKTIEGVSTSTTGFIGPARYGPTEGEPELLTSFNQFERIYGGLDPLAYGDPPMPNFLAHAVRAFFDNGGSRLYVARAFSAKSSTDDGVARAVVPVAGAERAAAAGVAAATSAVGGARGGLAAAEAAAREAIKAAITHIQLVQGAPAGLATLDLNGDVADQIDTLVTAMPDGPAKTAVTAAVTAATPALDAAVAVRDRARSTAGDSIATRLGTASTGIGSAVADGTAAANAVTPLPDAFDAAGLTTAATAVNTVRATAESRIAGLTTALGPLQTAQSALGRATGADRLTAAQAVATAAGALLDAAEAAANAALALPDPVESAAQAARLNARVAERDRLGLLRARFPGASGNMTVTVTGRLSANVLAAGEGGGAPRLRQTQNHDLVFRTSNSAIYTARRAADLSWELVDAAGATTALTALDPTTDQVRTLTLSVVVEQPGRFAQPQVWDGLTISAERLQDGLTNVFAATIANRARMLETPLVVESAERAPALAATLLGPGAPAALAALTAPGSTAQGVSVTYRLTGGNDGVRPSAQAYAGRGDADTQVKSGLKSLEDLEEISIVAAPGLSYVGGDAAYGGEARQAHSNLIVHCELMRYRVAVLDSPEDQSLGGVRAYRAQLTDTTRAALYYPWVRILDPVTQSEISVPPSGFVTGIYARNDVERGVHKAPANEPVRGAIGLEQPINKAQQDILNPLGINCLRFFENRGSRVWGARTISSDPEWKYLNVRRFFIYLEASIERATQWAVFEPNGDALWANVRRTVSDFLFNEWSSGRLFGLRAEDAFFVRCDRSTMTQNDLDNGRMICLIGVAPLYPAEFVIFRIGQWTADRRG